jgi:hypothetical protein
LTNKVYADEPWISVRWEDENQYVHTEWKAFANSEEFRAGLMKVLDAIRENHAIRYLSDTRKIKVIVREDQKWADETWFPLVAAAGLKRFAAVTAEAGLGKLTVEEVFDHVHLKGLEVSKFSSVAAARTWLAEI